MSASLDKYLTEVYRRDVLGKPMAVEMPEPDPKLMAEIEAEIKRIDELRLGAHLANRDFVAYQNRRALVALRDQLKAQAKVVPFEYGPRGTAQREIDDGHEPT